MRCGTRNCAALKQLGLTSEGHQVDIDDRQFNVMYDPVHNMKCSRNGILEKQNNRYTSAGKVLTVCWRNQRQTALFQIISVR